MTEYILLAVAAAIVVIMLVMRTHTAICFLALCAGSVLLGVSGDNVALLASSLTSGMSYAAMTARIILLFVPLAVCVVALRGYIRKSLLPLAFVPAVSTALLAVMLSVPLLTDSTETTLRQTETWAILVQYQEFIVGVGMVAALALIIATIKKPQGKHKKHRH